MQAGLASLDSVKAWLGSTTTNDDLLLTRLIGQVSRFIANYLQRPTLFRQEYVETYDGTGSARLMLRNWPVLSVESLAIGVLTVSAAQAPGHAGYSMEAWNGLPPGRPQTLTLNGYRFSTGLDNVAVTYAAGYAVDGEAHTVPSGDPYSIGVDAPHGPWAVDEGVSYADGTALTRVTANPSTGQYSIDGRGNYAFAAADAGSEVLISYSFVPADLEQACIELVAERYRYKDRIGESSKTIGGQVTAAFSLKDMPDYVRELLQPYMSVVPV